MKTTMIESDKDRIKARNKIRIERNIRVKSRPSGSPAIEAERLIKSMGHDNVIAMLERQIVSYRYDAAIEAYGYGGLWYSEEYVDFAKEVLHAAEQSKKIAEKKDAEANK